MYLRAVALFSRSQPLIVDRLIMPLFPLTGRSRLGGVGPEEHREVDNIFESEDDLQKGRRP